MRAKFSAIVLMVVAGIGLLGAAAAFGYWIVGVNTAPAGSGFDASLSAPTNVSATVNGSSAITVNFTTAVTQLSGGQYEVIRSSGPGTGTVVCGPETLATNTGSSCQDTNLNSGTVYGYTIEALLDSWTAPAATNPSAETYQAPAISSGSSTTFTVGTAGSFPVTTTGFPTNTISNANFTNCTASTLPTGVSFTDNANNTATIASTTSSPTGSYAICINASNGVGSAATQKFTLTVNQAPAISSGSSTTFTVGTAGASL